MEIKEIYSLATLEEMLNTEKEPEKIVEIENQIKVVTALVEREQAAFNKCVTNKKKTSCEKFIKEFSQYEIFADGVAEVQAVLDELVKVPAEEVKSPETPAEEANLKQAKKVSVLNAINSRKKKTTNSAVQAAIAARSGKAIKHTLSIKEAIKFRKIHK